MKIKTSILQEMVSKAVKGASNNKMIPISSFIGIELEEVLDKCHLSLTTTDGSNQLLIDKEVENTKEFYSVVDVDRFSKLVAKTTSEFIELNNKDNYLEFKGNGTYKLDIPVNEEGEIVKFPLINIDTTKESIKLSVEKLKSIISTLKVSVAKTMEVPCLTGYYISDKSVATDRQMMSYIKDSIIDEPILISSEMAELLQLLEGETVNLLKEDNKLYFAADNILIYGKQLEGIDKYPVSQIEQLMSLNYKYSVKCKKQDLLNVLDRMSLFVGNYDKNGVILTFSTDGLEITSQESNATEIIELDMDANVDYEEFSCLIDIEMLTSQVQKNISDTIEIHYGQAQSIILVEGNTTTFICLLEKE